MNSEVAPESLGAGTGRIAGSLSCLHTPVKHGLDFDDGAAPG